MTKHVSAKIRDEDEKDVVEALINDYPGTQNDCVRAALLHYAENRGIDVDNPELDLVVEERENEQFTAETYEPDDYDGELTTEQLREIVEEQDQPVINPAHVPPTTPNNQSATARIVAGVARYQGVSLQEVPDVVDEVLGDELTGASEYMHEQYDGVVRQILQSDLDGYGGGEEQKESVGEVSRLDSEMMEKLVGFSTAELVPKGAGAVSTAIDMQRAVSKLKSEIEEECGDVVADILVYGAMETKSVVSDPLKEIDNPGEYGLVSRYRDSGRRRSERVDEAFPEYVEVIEALNWGDVEKAVELVDEQDL